jgi:hypothetical protein
MTKHTKTQSFNADENIVKILSSVKQYKIKKDVFIRNAIDRYYKEEILPFQLMVTKTGKYKDVPF